MTALDICIQWFEKHTSENGISELFDYVFYPKNEIGISTATAIKNLKHIFYDARIPLYPKYEYIEEYLVYGIRITKLYDCWRRPYVINDPRHFNQEDNAIKSRVLIHLERVKLKNLQRKKNEYDNFLKKLREEHRQRSYNLLKRKLKEESIECIRNRIDLNMKDGKMEDKLRANDLRARIYEIVSGLSKENKKCNDWYLRSDLSRKGHNKGEIYQALKFLKEKETIYDIPYLDWFISLDYRAKENIGDDTLQRNIFKIIKNFSLRFNWKFGIKQTDLFEKLLEKDFLEEDIRSALNLMREKGIIYKKVFLYWFTKDYNKNISVSKHVTEEDITEEDITEEDITEDGMIEENEPSNEKEKDIKEKTKDENAKGEEDKAKYKEKEKKEKEEDNIENDYSDISGDVDYLTTRWKKLKATFENLIQDREKEIAQQKELERLREESKNRQKELNEKIAELEKEKERLKKLFDLIRIERNDIKRTEEKKRL